MDDRFRTIVKPESSVFKTDHATPIILMGSCFADNIGSKLTSNRFNVLVNPFGVLYNPVSIQQSVKNICEKKQYSEKDLFLQEGIWRSFDFHSSFGTSQLDETISLLNDTVDNASSFLHRSEIVIITLGTSFVYYHKEKSEVVANCHKEPGTHFDRTLLSIDTIVNALENIFKIVRQIRKTIKVIITVSPVRHLRDNPTENQISKAQLIIAANQVVSSVDNSYYFPAYEIMMDDLRDYRFYASDMVHPNDTAIDYIWNAFVESCVHNRSLQFMKEYAPVIQALGHRIQNRSQAETFINKNLELLQKIKTKYPEVNLEKDVIRFKSSIDIE